MVYYCSDEMKTNSTIHHGDTEYTSVTTDASDKALLHLLNQVPCTPAPAGFVSSVMEQLGDVAQMQIQPFGRVLELRPFLGLWLKRVAGPVAVAACVTVAFVWSSPNAYTTSVAEVALDANIDDDVLVAGAFDSIGDDDILSNAMLAMADDEDSAWDDLTGGF